ncbi:MAG: cadherin domain-containing protein, partial [Bacteroidales bacterium]
MRSLELVERLGITTGGGVLGGVVGKGTIPSEVIPGSVLSPLGTFVNVAPTIANHTFTVNENALTGTSVGNVLASDPNLGQTLTYSFVTGNTNNAFSINSISGELSVANPSALNYEELNYFNLIVNVQDNGTTSLNSQAMININVLNINEPPLILPQNFTVTANQTNGIVVGSVSATDPDAGQTLTFSILAGNSNNAFTINSSTGVLVLDNFLDLGLTNTNAFSLVIKVQDDGFGQLVNQATIIVYIENLYGCGSSGNITYQVWNNIGLGTDVSDLTNSMYYPFNPTYSTALTTMEAPGNFSDSFGARIAGYICAPATGSYSFWIASDDNSELWLSTDNQTANTQKIAFVTSWTNPREWNKFPSQKSAQINLVKGQNYYVEALMKDGNGSDNLAVGWLKPGQTGTLPSEVIPGSVLSPMGSTLPILVSTIGLPSNLAISEGSELLLTALVLPLNAANRNLNWISNNPSVATVNSSGVVNGVIAGTAMIVATSTDGSIISDYCQITVNHPPCTSSGSIS